MQSFIASLQELSLSEPPPRTAVPMIREALVMSPHTSLNGYLNITSVCFHLSENRFSNLFQRADLLSALFRKLITDNRCNIIQWMFNDSEKISFIDKLLSKKSYIIPLSLSFSMEDDLNQKILAIVFEKFPNITELRFHGDHKIDNQLFVSFVNSHQNLLSLEIPSCISQASYRNICWPPSLKILTVSDNITDRVFEKILIICQELEHLKAPSCPMISENFFNTVNFPSSLITLNLDSTSISNIALNSLARNCLHLRSLSLYRCENITDSGIKGAGFSLQTKISFHPFPITISWPPPRCYSSGFLP